jgi:hypothetical protein
MPQGPLQRSGSTPTAAAAAEGSDSAEDAAARQLTKTIANAASISQIANILTAHSTSMDIIHITACITRMSKMLGPSPSYAAQMEASALLVELGDMLLTVLQHADARGIANVLWGYGKLRVLPQVHLLRPLVEAFLVQLPSATFRDSAVVLGSIARLSEWRRGPEESTIPAALLLQLGTQVMQRLAAAAAAANQAREGQASAAQDTQQQSEPPGTPGAADRDRGSPTQAQGKAPVCPAPRDVSNTLMALARLGFVPGDDSALAGSQVQAEAQLTGKLQGLSLGVPGRPGPPLGLPTGSGRHLSVPVSLITTVVQHILHNLAAAKTLDLHETAAALKQLGLRELHAQFAEVFATHRQAEHAGSPKYLPSLSGSSSAASSQFSASGPFMQGSPGQQRPQMQARQYSSQRYMQQGYQQGSPGPTRSPQYRGGGGPFMGQHLGAVGQQPQWQGGPQQTIWQPVGPQQQQQQGFVLSTGPGPAGPQVMGHAGLAAGTWGQGFGGQAAGAGLGEAGYGLQPAAGQQQAQYPVFLQQPVGAQSPVVQQVVLQQQGQEGMRTYVLQQQGAEQQSSGSLGSPVLQQQFAEMQAPSGLQWAAAGASDYDGGQQRLLFMQGADTTSSFAAPGTLLQGFAGPAAGAQQLLVIPAGAGAGAGGFGQFEGAETYQPRIGVDLSGTLAAPGGVGAMLLGDPQQQQQQLQLQQLGEESYHPQLQLLQPQAPQQLAGVPQQQPGQSFLGSPLRQTGMLQQLQQAPMAGQGWLQGQQLPLQAAGGHAVLVEVAPGIYQVQS